MLKLTLVFAVLFSLVYRIKCANILGLMGCTSPSHHVWNKVIFEELALRGHNLTILSVDVEKIKLKNLHYIHLEKAYEAIRNDEDRISLFDLALKDSFSAIPLIYKFYLVACRGALRSEGLQTLLNYPKDFKFDGILFDTTLGPCLAGFIHKFNYPPVIGVTAFKISPDISYVMGGHLFPGYIPHYSLQYNNNMTLAERFHNTLIYLGHYLYNEWILMPELESLKNVHFSNDTPSLIELARRAEIMLVNTHPSIDYSESLPPNIIEVGGLQIKNSTILPKDISDFINKSEKKIILISLGTNINIELLGIDKCKIILNTAKKLPQYNFIWKINLSNELGEIPSNLLMLPWLPQSALLAHPKMAAFLTHAGSLSTQESIWFGIPMITLPFIMDQKRNSHKSVTSGIAIELNFVTMTTEKIMQAIKTVSEMPSYKQNILKLSKRFRSRQVMPLDKAIWWIEYIIDNPNYNILKSPVLNLGYIRSNSLDIFALMAFISCAALGLLLACILKIVKIVAKEDQYKIKQN